MLDKYPPNNAKTSQQTFENTGNITMIKSFLKDENGATAIEYGLIAALVAVAAIAALQTLGNNLIATFTQVSNTLAPPAS